MLREETKCDTIMQSAQDRDVDIEPAYKLIESYRMLYLIIYWIPICLCYNEQVYFERIYLYELILWDFVFVFVWFEVVFELDRNAKSREMRQSRWKWIS